MAVGQAVPRHQISQVFASFTLLLSSRTHLHNTNTASWCPGTTKCSQREAPWGAFCEHLAILPGTTADITPTASATLCRCVRVTETVSGCFDMDLGWSALACAVRECWRRAARWPCAIHNGPNRGRTIPWDTSGDSDLVRSERCAARPHETLL